MVCWEMLRNKKPFMAIHVLMMVVTYCRPGELLQSMREDLIRPVHGVASDWSLLLHPVQRGVPRKTQSYDDTFDLKNQIFPWITKVAAVLAARRPSERIFEYRYEEFSQDKAGQHRTMLDIKKTEKVGRRVGPRHHALSRTHAVPLHQ